MTGGGIVGLQRALDRSVSDEAISAQDAAEIASPEPVPGQRVALIRVLAMTAKSGASRAT
jgi:hypothetical protein